jgi:hypothetical protein
MNGADASTTFTDSAPSPNTFTASNAEIDTAQSKFGGASGLFNGTNAKITTPDNAAFDVGTGAFTIDFWVRFNALPGTVATFCGANDSAGTNTLQVRFNDVSNDLQCTLAGGGAYSSSWNPSVNTWYHIAIARSGTTLKFFVDGTQVGVDKSSNDNVVVTTVFAIGSTDNNGEWFNGWIDEFRLSNVARWTANFTPPQSAYAKAVSGQVIIL